MQQRGSISFRCPSNVTIAIGVSFLTSLYFYLPVMTLYLLKHDLSLLQISTMNGLILFAQFAMEVPTGVVADRWGRKASWVLAVFFQFFGEAWFFFARSYWEYLVIAILAGIGFAFSSGAVEALIYDTLPAEDRQMRMKKALGNISAAGRIGNLFAFLASGVIFSQLTSARFSIAIALTVLCVGVGAVFTLFASEERKPHFSQQHHSSLILLKRGFHTLRCNPALLRIVLLMILSDPFGFYLISLTQLYFVQAAVASAWFGPILAIGSLLAAFSERNAYAIENRFGKKRTLLIGTLLPGVLYILMAPVRQPVIAILSLLCLYAVMNTIRPLLRSYVNHYIANGVRATTLSMIQLIGSIYTALMGLVLGYIGGKSISALFIFMGMVILMAAITFQMDERNE